MKKQFINEKEQVQEVAEFFAPLWDAMVTLGNQILASGAEDIPAIKLFNKPEVYKPLFTVLGALGTAALTAGGIIGAKQEKERQAKRDAYNARMAAQRQGQAQDKKQTQESLNEAFINEVFYLQEAEQNNASLMSLAQKNPSQIKAFLTGALAKLAASSAGQKLKTGLTFFGLGNLAGSLDKLAQLAKSAGGAASPANESLNEVKRMKKLANII